MKPLDDYDKALLQRQAQEDSRARNLPAAKEAVVGILERIRAGMTDEQRLEAFLLTTAIKAVKGAR